MKQRILAEGYDLHVILQICIKHGLDRPKGFDNKKDFEENFAFKSKKGEPLGKKELIGRIPELLRESDLQTLAIVVDADKSAVSTWQSISATLQKSGYTNLPVNPDTNGTIIRDSNPDLPNVGVWIMPDNQNPGEIEDFFMNLIDPQNFHLQRARESVTGLIDDKINLFEVSDRSKADIHTWLAWQKDPGKSMGLAIKNNWTIDHHPLASQLSDWFAKLFELENDARPG